MQIFSFYSSETFWPAQKLSQLDLLPFFLEDFDVVDEIILRIILFLFFCFYIIRKLSL